MSNVEKLPARLLQRPTSMRETEIATLCKAYGYTLAARSGTSHRKWMKSGRPNVEHVVEDKVVKRTYLGSIAKALGVKEDGR
jgi:hypothetical protein